MLTTRYLDFRVYYSKNDNEHPHMFVVYTKESSLYRAYVAINERFPLFEVTLKAIMWVKQKAPL